MNQSIKNENVNNISKNNAIQKNINQLGEMNSINNFENSHISNDLKSSINNPELFKEEKEYLKRKNTNNETVLDKKIKNEIKNKSIKNISSSFIQPHQISTLEKSLHKSILSTNHKNEFLSVRLLPIYDEKQFISIRRRIESKYNIIFQNLIAHKCQVNIDAKVGPFLLLTTLIENSYLYNNQYINKMNEKYQRFKKYICNYRTIYGDGNCYYRAVMYRYIELLILNKKSQYFRSLIIDINKSFESDEIKKRLCIGKEIIKPDLIIIIMFIILDYIEHDRIMDAYNAFYKALSLSKAFDFSLILYFRYILYDYIKNNEKKMYLEDFPILIGNLLPSQYEDDGKFDYNSFYEKYLLKMFTCAEKIIIYLTPFVLGVNLDVVLFDDNEDEILKHFKFVGKDELKIKDTIFIINKKGHYEIVYSFQDVKNYNYIYKNYRYEIQPKFIKIDPAINNIYMNIKNSTDNSNISNPSNLNSTSNTQKISSLEKNTNNLNNKNNNNSNVNGSSLEKSTNILNNNNIINNNKNGSSLAKSTNILNNNNIINNNKNGSSLAKSNNILNNNNNINNINNIQNGSSLAKRTNILNNNNNINNIQNVSSLAKSTNILTNNINNSHIQGQISNNNNLNKTTFVNPNQNNIYFSRNNQILQNNLYRSQMMNINRYNLSQINNNIYNK